MSKLFEVSVCGTKRVMNPDRISYAEDLSSFVRVYFSDRLYVDFDGTYEQFIQLWREALDEDVRTAEQKQADKRQMIDALYGTSANRGVQRSAAADHMYNQQCNCAVCAQTCAMRGAWRV